jgi:hypothetical protein
LAGGGLLWTWTGNGPSVSMKARKLLSVWVCIDLSNDCAPWSSLLHCRDAHQPQLVMLIPSHSSFIVCTLPSSQFTALMMQIHSARVMSMTEWFIPPNVRFGDRFHTFLALNRQLNPSFVESKIQFCSCLFTEN